MNSDDCQYVPVPITCDFACGERASFRMSSTIDAFSEAEMPIRNDQVIQQPRETRRKQIQECSQRATHNIIAKLKSGPANKILDSGLDVC
jgi:hypothetical protein